MCIECLLGPALSAFIWFIISQLLYEVTAIIIFVYKGEETEAQRV